MVLEEKQIGAKLAFLVWISTVSFLIQVLLFLVLGVTVILLLYPGQFGCYVERLWLLFKSFIFAGILFKFSTQLTLILCTVVPVTIQSSESLQWYFWSTRYIWCYWGFCWSPLVLSEVAEGVASGWLPGPSRWRKGELLPRLSVYCGRRGLPN